MQGFCHWQVPVLDSYHRILLKQLLPKILEIPGLLQAMLEWQQRKSDALQDLFDGDFCKTHPLLLKEVSIPIVIYQDDCETVNPLGSKTAVHRLGCIEHLLSSLQSHFLLAVYKSLDAKTYGLDTVLRPIVEEIQCLERDGITVDTPSFQGVVKFTVVQVVGD